jgi:serine/threonine-protein kinase PknG
MSGNGCTRPGCGGTIAPDGYCDECGHKAAAPVSTGATAATAATALSVSVHTRTSSRVTTTGRGGLGAHLVSVPPIPLRDPTTAVLADPQVPEAQRFCAKCGDPVGRTRKGKPGRVDGFCPKDRTPFSFRPQLSPGDRVETRYEILGAIAHGGLGWIYLARDRNISDSGADRWVVLKGLINTADPDAIEAAVAERRFLVEVDHPNIVKIHDFVQGYIVMEYVGGRSLKDLALTHTDANGQRAALPLEQVLAYGIEVLPALGYLHDRGLLFCDFKPDNVIHAEEQLKLIDLGAVRRINDHTSALWGTPGYQAPELAEQGASIASDIYTVGRTLAVLSFDFGGFSSKYAASLPHPGDVPLLAREESYHRLLLRATHADPAQRFASAAEFGEQALGVLREVLSAADGAPRPSLSILFTPERRTFGTLSTVDPPDGPSVAAALPLPLVDPRDPSAGFLATLGGIDPLETVRALAAAPVQSPEVLLRLVRAHLERGDTEAATDALPARAEGDWRIDWYAGLIALASGSPQQASAAFDAVYSAVPGEPAARLALAAARDLLGDRDGAGNRYLRVWRVDHSYVSAAFALARILVSTGDRAGALSILDEVPESSSQYQAAQIAAVRASLDLRPGPIGEPDLLAASQRLERLRLDATRRANLSVEMLRGALDWLTATAPAPAPAVGSGWRSEWATWRQVLRRRGEPSVPVGKIFLGESLREHDVRAGLERAYRLLASLETDPARRYALVDLANAVRPQTVV